MRSYAQPQKDPEWRGWAYFLAGYQEYEGQQYPEAAQDLAQARGADFSLADYAVFYQASALGQPAGCRTPRAVQGFRCALSPKPAALSSAGIARQRLAGCPAGAAAVDALAPNRKRANSRRSPCCSGRPARRTINRWKPAAAAFQDVYYNFPLSSPGQSRRRRDSGAAPQLGAGLSGVRTTNLRSTRVEALFKAGRYADALKEYGDLLKDEPASPMVPRWQLGQARCLLHLRRSADALQVLFTHFASPDLEAQRLALLVQVHAQQADALAITQDLAQLETSYARISCLCRRAFGRGNVLLPATQLAGSGARLSAALSNCFRRMTTCARMVGDWHGVIIFWAIPKPQT